LCVVFDISVSLHRLSEIKAEAVNLIQNDDELNVKMNKLKACQKTKD
jgi:hypothetical protein